MKLAQAMKRIEDLERKVKELEARPMQETHFHYHNAPPAYQPQISPMIPQPFIPWNPMYGGQGYGAQYTAAQAQ